MCLTIIVPSRQHANPDRMSLGTSMLGIYANALPDILAYVKNQRVDCRYDEWHTLSVMSRECFVMLLPTEVIAWTSFHARAKLQMAPAWIGNLMRLSPNILTSGSFLLAISAMREIIYRVQMCGASEPEADFGEQPSLLLVVCYDEAMAIAAYLDRCYMAAPAMGQSSREHEDRARLYWDRLIVLECTVAANSYARPKTRSSAGSLVTDYACHMQVMLRFMSAATRYDIFALVTQNTWSPFFQIGE